MASPGASCVNASPDTVPLASGSAFVTLGPVNLPLVRPEGRPGISQPSFSETGRTRTDSKGFCIGRAVTAGTGCGAPARGEHGPWAGPGRARCQGRGGHRRPHRLHFAVWLRREAEGSASSPQVSRLGGREEPAGRDSRAPRPSPRPGPAGSSRTAGGSPPAPALLTHRPGGSAPGPGHCRTGWSPGQRSRSRGRPRLGARQVSGRGRCRPPQGAASPAGAALAPRSWDEVWWPREKQIPGYLPPPAAPPRRRIRRAGPRLAAEGAGGTWGDA